MKKTYLLLAFSFTLSLTSFAQEDSTQDDVPALRVDLLYQSNSVYLGRKDSLPLPYLIAGLRYNAPSGFYADASAFLATDERRLDALYFDLGYEFSKASFYGGISASTYVFNPQSVNVMAEASKSLNGYAGFSLPFLEPGASASLAFGSGSVDYLAGLSLQHSFTTENEAFHVTPAIYLNAGTQNYYNEYYRQRKFNSGSGKGRGKEKNTNTVDAGLSQKAVFNILDYEFIGKMEYKTRCFTFSFEPQYVIPQSPSTVTITRKSANGATSRQVTPEVISNSFFWTLGVSYRINLHKHA